MGGRRPFANPQYVVEPLDATPANRPALDPSVKETRMPSRIDHIIIGVRDLAQASADYTAAGFTVTAGGEHTGGRTHNALIAFADTSYLELIAYRDPDTPRDDAPYEDDPWWQTLARGEGFLGFALRMDDATAEAAALLSRGVGVSGPFAGGRERPDGQRVAWRSIEPEGIGPLPFLIEDVTPRPLRIPVGPATAHPCGVGRLLGLGIVVDDLAAATDSFARLLGRDGEAVTSDLEGVAAATRFTVGPHTIGLLSPTSAESLPGRALHSRGPGPYALTLGGVADETLPLARTHGARISITGA